MEKQPSTTPPGTILVADDDLDTRNLLQLYLERAGFKVEMAVDGQDAVARLSESVLVALFDLMMPKASGLDCLRHAREKFPDTPVIMISAAGEIQDAVRAMQMGAFYYLQKPFKAEELLTQVRQAVRSVELLRENRSLRQAIGLPMPTSSFIGRSPSVQALLGQVRTVSHLATNVLITGESGTGKTTLARLIHQSGPRASQPFVALSCAALPRDLVEAELFGHERGAFTGAVSARPGRAEMADGGTLFLDEIGDMPIELQPKLLTFLEDRTVQRLGGISAKRIDVRFIAATHQDLQTLCRERNFREDLYYRLNVLSLRIPPLRERREDIPLLIESILGRIARQRNAPAPTISKPALQALAAHDWPGNVRELENVLERSSAFARDAVLQEADLLFVSTPKKPEPDTAPAQDPPIVPLAELEKQAVVRALRICQGKKALAATQLGISEKSIYNMIKRLGIADQG